MKKIISIIVIFCLLLSFSSCSASPQPEDIVGLWEGEKYIEGNKHNTLIEIREDNSFTYLLLINDKFSECITGDYEIKGKEIYLYHSDSLTHHGKAYLYEYSDGHLTGETLSFNRAEGKKLSISSDLAVLIAANYSGINKLIEETNMLESFMIHNSDGVENEWDSYSVEKYSYVGENTWQVELEGKISGYDYYGDFIYSRKLTIIVYVSLNGEVKSGYAYISSFSSIY